MPLLSREPVARKIILFVDIVKNVDNKLDEV